MFGLMERGFLLPVSGLTRRKSGNSHELANMYDPRHRIFRRPSIANGYFGEATFKSLVGVINLKNDGFKPVTDFITKYDKPRKHR
jgi:hypothetical protein